MMDINRKSAFFFCIGAFGGASALFAVVYLRKWIRKACTKVSMEELSNAISLSSLKKLSQVSNVSIRLCAYDIITARGLKPRCLNFIIQWCYSDDEECVLKACTVLEGFAKNPNFRKKIINFGGLEALSHAIYRSWTKKYNMDIVDDSRIQRHACMAIFDLISGDGETENSGPKVQLVDKNPSFIPALLGIMKETNDREVEKLGLYLIHLIAVCDYTREKLKDHWEVVEVVSQFVVKNQGHTQRLRIAFQVLVTLVNVLMADEEVKVLEEIWKFGVVRPTIACFKSENSELVYWAVGLIHEFAVNNVALEEICGVPILLKSLYRVLVSNDASVQRLVFRVLRYLSDSSEEFKMAVIHYKQLLARLPVYLASGDEDLVSWSLFLVHDIAKTGVEAIELLFKHSNGVVEALVQLSMKYAASTQDVNTTCRYIAEILGFFCSVETIQCDVVKAGALRAVMVFAMMDDVDVKFWSTSLLLNLSMSADILKEEIVKEDGVRILIDLAVSDTDEPQIAMQAAKTLIMLGFIDTCYCVDLKSSGYNSSCSVLVDCNEFSPNSLGINMIVVDPMTLGVVEAEAFDTGHDPGASSRLTQYIGKLPVMSLVFVVVKGEANYFLTDDAKNALADLGLTGYEYGTGELWVFYGQKRGGEDSFGEVQFQHGYDCAELKIEIPQGNYVNNQVEVLIVVPLLEILMSTPPESNISKVSELELLTILARHDSLRTVMLRKAGFLEYMAKLIWNMESRSLDDLRSNPMLVAHCIGAMKTISGLVPSEGAVIRCLQCGVINEVIRLLFFINDITLRVRKDEKRQRNETKVSAKSAAESDLSFLSSSPSAMQEKVPFSSVNESTPTLHGKECRDENFDGEISCDYFEGFEEAFISLTQLSVTLLYHCSKLNLADDSLYTALLVHVLWCTLLTCNDQLRRAIAIPVENILTCCSHQQKSLVIEPERSPVCLNDKEMTKALMLSSDRLEVINFNWTFESVHATHPVGRCSHIHGTKPAGWYYEVYIKTQGILQIGWRTRDCEYGSEKGVGVGDNEHSCAFDGARVKIWNGPACQQVGNDYGKKWAVDDVVSCLFSWSGEVSFWLNGEDLGVAFDDMNPELDHYPGVSLAMDQHCCFNFGGEKPFRFEMPKGYIAVNDVVGTKRSHSRRPRSKSYTKGSFESIAEEDEETSQDVDNPHVSKLQRCCTSEPSLRNNENMKPSGSLSRLVERRRFSSSTTSYNPQRPSTPSTCLSTPSTPLTPVTPFTPVTPLSPFWSPVFTRNSSADIFAATICLYFEAEVNESAYRARNVGFVHVKTGETSSCEFYESQNMSFPSHAAEDFNLTRAPSVIGCGLLWPDGVYFTLDGVFSSKVYCLPGDEVEAGNILPWVTCPLVKVNYGQEPFLFRHPNGVEERLAGAEMLHYFSRQLLEKLT